MDEHLSQGKNLRRRPDTPLGSPRGLPRSTATAIHTAIRTLGPADLEVLLRFVERCERASWIGSEQAVEWRRRIQLRLALLDLMARRSRVLRLLR